MRRIIILFLFITTLQSVFSTTIDSTADNTAEDASYWKVETTTLVSFNQVYLNNWSAGGESSIAGKSTIGFDAD